MNPAEVFIYIPGEGDWPIARMARELRVKTIRDMAHAKEIYLRWAKRKRLPSGATIWRDAASASFHDLVRAIRRSS